MSALLLFSCLVNSRHNLVLHNALVLLPVVPIFLGTLLIVSTVTVDKENSKVDDVEVSEDHTPILGGALDHFSPIEHFDSPFDVAARR